MIIFLLKLCALGLQLALLLGLLAQLRYPYRFRLWSRAWSVLFFGMLLQTERRAYEFFWLDADLRNVLIHATISGCFALGFHYLYKILHGDLLVAVPTAAAHITIDGFSVIQTWDEEAERLFGWSAAEAVGKTIMQTIMPPQEWEAHREGIARLQAQEHPVPVQRLFPGVTALRRDGTAIAIEVAATGTYTAPEGWTFQAVIRPLMRQ